MKKILSALLTASMLLASLVICAVPASADGTVNAATNTFNATDDNPTISTAADYIAFFNAAFNQMETFEGKTITMLNDITLNDTSAADWYTKADVVKLEGKKTNSNGKWFMGNFDGNGHTLKGAYVAGGADSYFREWDCPVGLFPCLMNGSIKNLTVDGFYVVSSNTFDSTATWGKGGTGALVGHLKNNNGGKITIDNVTMKNGTVACTDTANGGLSAFIGCWDGGDATKGFENGILQITNCTVENTVKLVSGNTTIAKGGIFGYIKNHHGLDTAVIDLSASKFVPEGSTAESNALPIAGYIAVTPDWDITVTLINNSKGINKEVTIPIKNADDLLTPELNKLCVYGSTYVDPGKFVITWSVNGVTTTEEYTKGATPSYKGSTDKPATETHIYEFKGWSPAIATVSANVTYTAEYDEYEKITVTWVVDGVSTVEYYAKGTMPYFKGETDKEADDDYAYTFKGWDKTVVTADENVTYTAVYDKTAKYEVTWVIDGVETKEIYFEGTKPSYKGTVKKADDDEYTYKFIGWDKEIVAVTEDVVYTAQFEKTAKNASASNDTEEEEKSGCGSSISVGFAAVVAVGLAGAAVVRKKED